MSRKLFKNNMQLQTGAPSKEAFLNFTHKYMKSDLIEIRIILISEL